MRVSDGPASARDDAAQLPTKLCRTRVGNMAVTPQEIRLFASDCVGWSDAARDASQRDLIVRIARSWINIASALERRLDNGQRVDPDLRSKLD